MSNPWRAAFRAHAAFAGAGGNVAKWASLKLPVAMVQGHGMNKPSSMLKRCSKTQKIIHSSVMSSTNRKSVEPLSTDISQQIASNSSEMSTKQTFRQAKTYVASRTFMQTDPKEEFAGGHRRAWRCCRCNPSRQTDTGAGQGRDTHQPHGIGQSGRDRPKRAGSAKAGGIVDGRGKSQGGQRSDTGNGHKAAADLRSPRHLLHVGIDGGNRGSI